MQSAERPNPLLYRLVIVLACLGFGIALAGFAYAGFFTRLWADDYCYEVSLRVHGFFAGQWVFYQGTSNRFAVIPFVGLNELLGPWSLRLWALEAVLLLLAGLYALLLQAGRRLLTMERLLLAEMVVFFTLWQAPNRFQVLYWRTGMLTYLMPMVFILFLMSAILQFSRSERRPGWLYPVIFLLAFFSAGFSETTAALQAGLILLALALLYLARRFGFAMPPLFHLLSAAAAGTLAGMLALIVSPATGLRMQNMPQSAGALTLISLSFRFAWDFIYDTVSTQPLPTLISLFAPLAFGAAWAARREPVAGFARLAALALGVAVSTYLLVTASFAPSVFVQVAYPEPRALIPARLVMTVGLTASGWLLGLLAWNLARRLRLPGRAVSLAALAAMVVLALYPLRATGAILQEAGYLQQRAQGWDQRDTAIRDLSAGGENNIRIEALDSMFGLMDLTDQPHLWPNNCIAGYYDLQSVTGFIP